MYICDMEPILKALRVAVLRAEHSILGSEWRRSPQVDPFARMYFVESGQAWMWHHDRQFDLKPGWLYVVPTHSKLSFHCPHRVVIAWVHFTAQLWGQMDLLEYLQCDMELKVPKPQETKTLMKRLFRCAVAKESGQLGSAGILLQLISSFADTRTTGDTQKHSQLERFSRVLEYADTHVGARVTIDELARIAHMERSYFSRVFSQHFGLSPVRYVLRRRIERAQQLLIHTDLKLGGIAQQLGFTDGFHLSKTFKKFTGVSPQQLRKQGHISMP